MEVALNASLRNELENILQKKLILESQLKVLEEKYKISEHLECIL